MAITVLALALRSDIRQPIIVIDGDTLRRDGITYRLYGFDAPEIGQNTAIGKTLLGELITLLAI